MMMDSRNYHNTRSGDNNSRPIRALLPFCPFFSKVDISFWRKLLTQIKPRQNGSKQIEITCTYETSIALSKSTYAILTRFDRESFDYDDDDDDANADERSVSFRDSARHNLMLGELILFDSVCEFEKSDKRKLLINAGKKIWDAIISRDHRAEVDCALSRALTRFLMCASIDRATGTFYHWVAYPAFNYPPRIFRLCDKPEDLQQYFNESQLKSIITEYNNLPADKRHFFVLIAQCDGSNTITLQTFDTFWHRSNLEAWIFAAQNYSIYFGYTNPSQVYGLPGWPAKNFLLYLHVRLGELLRDRASTPNIAANPTSSSSSSEYNRNDYPIAVSRFVARCAFRNALKLLLLRIERDGVAMKPDEAKATIEIETETEMETETETSNRNRNAYNLLSESSVMHVSFCAESRPESAAPSIVRDVCDSGEIRDLDPDGDLDSDGDRDEADRMLRYFASTYAIIDRHRESNDLAASLPPPTVGWERNPRDNNRLTPSVYSVDFRDNIDHDDLQLPSSPPPDIQHQGS